MSDSPLLIYEQRDDVAWLTMNRPEVRNALSREHILAIRNGIGRASIDHGIRAIVLAGADPVFCAGADVNQYREASDRNIVLDDGGILYDTLDLMLRAPKPIIARVQKAAFGGAIGLIAASDLVVASDDTRFSLSEARLGLVPAVISQAILLALGPRNVRELMVRSEPFGVTDALRLNLIQRAAPLADIDNVIDQWMAEIRAGAPGALADSKILLHALTCAGMTASEQRELILNLAADRRASDEGQEGLAAFLEKRPPDWNPEPS